MTRGSSLVGVGEREQRRRYGPLIALAVVAPIGCLALGWWQWERFSSSSGGFQNLGYAFQWPLFAVFCVYAYRRFVLLEANRDDDAQVPSPTTTDPAVVDLLPTRPAAARSEQGGELGDYNAYLASLAAEPAPTPNCPDESTRSPR